MSPMIENLVEFKLWRKNRRNGLYSHPVVASNYLYTKNCMWYNLIYFILPKGKHCKLIRQQYYCVAFIRL